MRMSNKELFTIALGTIVYLEAKRAFPYGKFRCMCQKNKRK